MNEQDKPKREIVNKITTKNSHKLGDWIKAPGNWAMMKDMTRSEAAAKAQEDLGFLVTKAILVTTLKNIERKFPGKMERKGGQKPGTKMATTRLLARQMRRMNKAIILIADSLGYKIPDEIAVDDEFLKRLSKGIAQQEAAAGLFESPQ